MAVMCRNEFDLNSPGHHQNWLYGDVMRNGNMAAKARHAIQSIFRALFVPQKQPFSAKNWHIIQLSKEVFDECEKMAASEASSSFKAKISLSCLIFGLVFTRQDAR